MGWRGSQDQRRQEAWHFLQTGQFTGSMANRPPSGNGIAPGGLGGGVPDPGYVPKPEEEVEEGLGDSGTPGDPAGNGTSSSGGGSLFLPCSDSSDCASGWRCSGGVCRPPRNNPSGGTGATNDQGCGGDPTVDVANPVTPVRGGRPSGGSSGNSGNSGGGGGGCGAGTASGGGGGRSASFFPGGGAGGADYFRRAGAERRADRGRGAGP